MHKVWVIVVNCCVQKSVLYTLKSSLKMAVENTHSLYTSCARQINTFLSIVWATFVSVINKLYTLSTGPITITTIKLYKGVY